MTTVDHVVSMRGVRKTFGEKTVLDVPSLDLERGGVTALIGPNGAGKSTFVKLVTGLWLPSSADRLMVLGEDLRHRRRFVSASRDVGLVSDSTQLYGTLTVRENLEYMARLFKVPRRERDANVGYALEACGLESRSGERTWTLSTGLKQRANIARALVTRPRLLMLDEPTSGLDPVSVQRVYDAVFALKESGISIVLCTHIMQEVDDLCDRVVFLSEGVIVADGTASDLRDQVGSVVYSVPVVDGDLLEVRSALASIGVSKTMVRRDDAGLSLSFFDGPGLVGLDRLGLAYSRRRAELGDAFVALAGD